jgi:prepilin-type N-terminal cleavage/methylation domain-containing protein
MVREQSEARGDRGFTLVEILIVIVVLGVVSAVVTFSVRGFTDESEESVCDIDHRALTAVVEVYTTNQDTNAIPGATAADRMQALVDGGYLRSPSVHWEVNADGSLTGLGVCAD